MKVITGVSDINLCGFLLLKASCEYHNLDFMTLICEQRHYPNNMVKVAMLKEYLNTLDEKELIMATDGYDTIMLAGHEEMISKYYARRKETYF